MGLLAITVDSSELIRALERLPDQVLVRTKRASEVTANRIALEAKRRFSSQVSKEATGKTLAGILVDDDSAGTGYVVSSERNPMPNAPLFFDRGTVHQPARPFFDVSAQLEQGPHERRIREAIQDAIDEAGLGR